MSRNRKQYAVPHLIKANILDGFIGKMFGGARTGTVENQSEELQETPFEEHRHSDDHQIIQTTSKANPILLQSDWIRLAIIIDRVTCFVYVLLFIVMGFFHFI
jgi:hypothetical protein